MRRGIIIFSMKARTRVDKMKKNGFTLVELLIATVVGLVIMAAVYGVMTMAQRTSTGTERKVLTQQDTRSVLDFMASEIRMASYNPSMMGTTWWNVTTNGNVNGCGNVTALIGGAPSLSVEKRGILFADANNLFIAMDLGPLGTPNVYGVIGDAPNELIFYRYNSVNGEITRSVSCGNNEVILGGAASGTTVYNNTAVPALDLFEYFDRDGLQLTGAGSTKVLTDAQIHDIRRIQINIAAQTENDDPNTKQPRRMIYTTDILVRNHAVFLPNL